MLNDMNIACLPSLRPIYRLVINRSLKNIQSPEQSGYHTTTWNGKSNVQTLSLFKRTYSDSTKQLADSEGDGNRSFTDGLVDSSSPSTDTTCEMGNITLSHTHHAKDVIMVKNEVDIKSSARDR